ncbi:Mg-protoporphyrin IX methyl transferase [Luteitalea pratensis]|uniref:Mg-protoporphyrin IX methyl transferase n=1 Tax=Luteitalea pratensis TaxID=1855912 RepID=A0A143PRQ9_LUTPR|nr:methyltransferase domain-containing protein [Luteitalea pratensis]AMY10790.1 Mg-protoporphyrin IX methyl transferase [Luteitalea pratensis]
MQSCCGSPFESAADQQFNAKKVAHELKRYREQGPRPTTRLLIDDIARSGALSGTVLDIGCGIGGLTFGLLERGASRAVAVDASTAYVEAARQEAARQGRSDAIEFVHIDFVRAGTQLAPAGVVTLDRVVCCYPSCQQLLDAALDRAEQCLALSYPRDVWYVRAAMQLENGGRWLARNAFRTFVHSAAAIEATIGRGGFRLVSRHQTWMWSADVYVRE